jgi:hypothetical protein
MFEELRQHAGKLYGKYSGDVSKNDTDPDNMGVIMVRVPAVFGAGVEVPARPCLPYGHFYVPPVGTKVWVEFEGGDAAYAIWVGTWYPQGKVPPQAAISPPDNRVIQTASGHTIEILDKPGEEKITIKHKGNAFLNIDKNGSVLIANQSGSFLQLDADKKNATLMDENGNVITMTGDGVIITEKSGASTIQMTDDAIRVMGKSIILQAPSVSLTGDKTAMPTILATPDFITMFNLFAAHLHPSAVGPTGPPTPLGPILAPGTNISSGTVMK